LVIITLAFKKNFHFGRKLPAFVIITLPLLFLCPQLAKYVSSDEDLDAVEMHEPYTYLNGLTVDDLEDLLVDINVYRCTKLPSFTLAGFNLTNHTLPSGNDTS
jgi:hypothetical protein